MSLSDNERYAHATFGINTIYNAQKDIVESKLGYEHRDMYMSLKKLCENVWSTWSQSNSAYWICGTNFKAEWNGADPFSIAMENKIRAFRDEEGRWMDAYDEKMKNREARLSPMSESSPYFPSFSLYEKTYYFSFLSIR